MEIKMETKILNKLSKMLETQENCFTEEEIINKSDVFVMDVYNVSMFIAKTKEAKKILRRFIDKESIRREPNLKYEVCGKARFEAKKLAEIIDLLKACGDGIDISLAKNMPITLENEHFICILANKYVRE